MWGGGGRNPYALLMEMEFDTIIKKRLIKVSQEMKNRTYTTSPLSSPSGCPT